MKKSRKICFIIVMMILIYAAGLFGGLSVVTFLPGEWKRDSQEYYASQCITEYTTTGRVKNWRNGAMAAIIYDENGKFENFFRMNGDQFSINFVLQTENYVKRVLVGEKPIYISRFVKNLSKFGYTSFLYVGMPIRENGVITGAFFWVRELPDLAETLVGYAVIFTLFFALIVCILAAYMRIEKNHDIALRRYIDNITHELKSPIASIRALTEALTDTRCGKDENERNICYGMIIGEANRQERMICDSLTIAKLQSGISQPKWMNISAEDLCRPMAENQKELCRFVGVDLVVDEGLWQVPMLYTDPQMLSQLMHTLFTNARKYTEEGGTITLSAQANSKYATFCIEDSGCGISKSDLPHVFDRFYKGSGSTDSGSGLGLAIAKETCMALREKIWIRSEEGTGTSVYFTVRLAKVSKSYTEDVGMKTRTPI